jgi:hypothetical protein
MKSNNRSQLLATYAAGFLACLISYGLFFHLDGSRGSLLAWTIFVGVHFLERLGIFTWISVLVICAAVALPFAVSFYALQQKQRAFRVFGWLLVAILLFVTLYWGRTPMTFYDPMPGLSR